MIDLRELKKAKKFIPFPLIIGGETIETWEKFRELWYKITNYDLDKYYKNEPYLMTYEELEKFYIENSGIKKELIPYLNTKAMFEDDRRNGHIGIVNINGKDYHYRVY